MPENPKQPPPPEGERQPMSEQFAFGEVPTEPFSEVPDGRETRRLPPPTSEAPPTGPEPSASASLPSSTPSLPSATPAPPAPAAPKPPGPKWHGPVLAVLLVVLVLCAAPLWFFELWSSWNASSHQPPPVLARLDPHGLRADALAWSPDGRYLAEQATLVAGTGDSPPSTAIILWDTTTRQETRRFPGLYTTLAMAWSPDGLLLAVSDGARALIWSAPQVEGDGDAVMPLAQLVAPDKQVGVTGLAWSKDSQTLALIGEGGMTVWQPGMAGAWKQTQFFGNAFCSTGACDRALSWSPDGRWLLAAPWHDGNGQLGIGAWDTQTWQQAPLIAASAPLAWSPDSSVVLVRGSNESTLAALRAGSWETTWTLNPNPDLHQGYNVYPQAAGWSSDNKWLVGSADGWVDLWPTETRQSVWVWNEQHAGQGIYTVNDLAWSPDAHTLALVTDGTAEITLYDLRNPMPPGKGPGPLASAHLEGAFSVWKVI